MFKGLVGLVTGGASGLGKATAEHLVKQGGRIVICDLPSSSGSNLAKQLGNDAAFVPVDTMNYEDLECRISRMLEEVESKDEVFDDVSDQEDDPIEISPAQDECVQSDAELSEKEPQNKV